jgi:multidrug efflux system outer membrane protein
MNLGPDYRRPEPVDPPAAFQNAEESVASAGYDQPWWEEFGDPEIDGLVDRALAYNLDVMKAAARILELRAALTGRSADRLPKLNLAADYSRSGTTLRDQPPRGRDEYVITESFNLTLPLSFELDLWGRLAKAEAAARYNLLAAEASRRAVAQGVVAEVLASYFQIQALQRRLAVNQKSVDNYRRGLALVERRYELGLTNILEVRQAKRTLAQAEAARPSLLQELGLTQQRLAVLLGQYPEVAPPEAEPENYYRDLPPVPAGLPSELLLRRPDVQAAEASLRALNAAVGAAKAARFPSISLTGSLGYGSSALHQLIHPESHLWRLAGQLTAPLVHFGKLKAAQRETEAQYRRQAAEYARVVLTALSEVEGALLTRRQQLERRKRVLTFLEEARLTQQVAESRYERGLVEYKDVLDAQQVRYQAEDNLALVDLAIMTNRVTLHRALGGGWAEPRLLPPGTETVGSPQP